MSDDLIVSGCFVVQCFVDQEIKRHRDVFFYENNSSVEMVCFRIAKKSNDPIFCRLFEKGEEREKVGLFFGSSGIFLCDKSFGNNFGLIGHVPRKVKTILNDDMSNIVRVCHCSVLKTSMRSFLNREVMMSAVDVIDDLTNEDYNRLMLAIDGAINSQVILAEFSLDIKKQVVDEERKNGCP